MHIHLKVQHWVLWWFYLGIIGGAIALANILWRDLSPEQIKLVLALGVLNWVLGGAICYCYDGVKIDDAAQRHHTPISPAGTPKSEWHAASDFVLPGGRKSLLPPKY